MRVAESPRSLLVFAPSPVLTITVETGADGESDIHLHAGGQGFWVARMAVSLGAEVSLCCALGGLVEGREIAVAAGALIAIRRGLGRGHVTRFSG